MIDRIKLLIKVDINTDILLKNNFTKKATTIKICNPINNMFNIEERNYYNRSINKVYFSYCLETQIFIIEGRLINLTAIENKISVLGDLANTVYVVNNKNIVNVVSLYNEFKNINKLLYKLTNINLLIETFKVVKIEYCYNLYTEQVEEYIKILNKLFDSRPHKYHERYKAPNDYESCYITKKRKNKKEKRKLDNYVVNFYNKENEISKRKNITRLDIDNSKNILRLEIKVQSRLLKSICNKNNINYKTRQFGKFLYQDISKAIIKNKYKYFFGSTDIDFYSYQKAKEIIQNSNSKNKNHLLDYIYKLIKNNKSNKKDDEQLLKLGINRILTSGIDILPNPIKLLDDADNYNLFIIDGKHKQFDLRIKNDDKPNDINDRFNQLIETV